MNFSNSVKLHKLLSRELGDDLVYSLSLDHGNYYVSISVHKSKTWEYRHGRNIQTCLIAESDMRVGVDILSYRIATMYKKLLIARK